MEWRIPRSQENGVGLWERCRANELCQEDSPEMKKKDVPLFTHKKRIGRPIKYDFTPFTKESTDYVIFNHLTLKNYDSLRSTFARWRRRKGVEGRFEYDVLEAKGEHPEAIVIWRQREK